MLVRLYIEEVRMVCNNRVWFYQPAVIGIVLGLEPNCTKVLISDIILDESDNISDGDGVISES